jgi:hypothetical protein
VVFGPSDYEELTLLAPIEIIRSYFVHYQYRAGAGVCSVLHDYRVDAAH